MSFVLPPRPELDQELVRAREQELERKAEHYSELHPEADNPVETRRARPLQRLLGAIKRSSAD